MTQFEIDNQFKMLENQQNIVNVLKDLVVVQGLTLKANGHTRLSSNELIKLEDIIQHNMK